MAEVFAFIADPHTRTRILPDNFSDVRVLVAGGPGARFAFVIHTDRGAYASETETTTHHPPDHLVERTTERDTTYETHWRLTEQDGGTLLRAETWYQSPGGLMSRLLGRTFGRKALQQSLLVELLRLRDALEKPKD
jgi:hypothetical protein